MQITLDQIPEKGFELKFDDVEPWALQAAAQATEGEVQRLDGYLFILRYDDHLQVTGELTAGAIRECDRCSERGQMTVGGPLRLSYVPRRRLGDAPTELSRSDLDLGFYEGGALDLAAVVAEHFALVMPYRLTCGASGFVLEQGEPCVAGKSAKPEVRTLDPRFAKLMQLKLDD